MRYLGLDLGTKSLGISITDKTNTLVSPLKVIKFNMEDYTSIIPEVLEIVKNYDIKKIVLGLPKNMDGTIGFAGNRSIEFKKLLEDNNLEVILWDERLTTVTAENIIHENGKNIKNTKNVIDSIAACVILENYLSSGDKFDN